MNNATPHPRTSKRQSSLRFELLNAFVDQGLAGLSRSELAVWLILYRDTKRDGTARTSLADLGRRGGMDRQTASRAVTSLKKKKLLLVKHQGGLGLGPSTYIVFPYPMK